MRELGYVQGQQFRMDYQAAMVPFDQLAARTVALVRRPVAVILAAEGVAAARAAKQASPTVPVVMVGVPDAVEQGLVASLARPGGNLTGISLPVAALVGKRLELLREAVPGMTRIAVLWNPDNPDHGAVLPSVEKAAQALAMQLHPLRLRSHQGVEAAFAALRREHVQGLLVLDDPLFFSAQLSLLAFQSQVPMIAEQRGYAVGGGLMTYGPSGAEMYRRAAVFVAKILKGVKPADLPVEQPMKFELVINLTTAQALGLTIPPSLLFLADEVIR
jgi:putative tryptophan/tyrosine transport system substrate-binding protein